MDSVSAVISCSSFQLLMTLQTIILVTIDARIEAIYVRPNILKDFDLKILDCKHCRIGQQNKNLPTPDTCY